MCVYACGRGGGGLCVCEREREGGISTKMFSILMYVYFV